MYIYTVVFIIATVFFLYNPHFDLLFSKNFYDQETMSFLKSSSLEFMNNIPFYIMYVLAFITAIHTCIRFFKTESLHPKHYKFPIFLLIVWLLIPNAILRTTLKPTIGRARPNMIQEFGGTYKYNPPFYRGEIKSNKASFVSTHTALACLLFVFAFLLNGIKHFIATLAVAIMALIVGYGRISTGNHFLSDVIYAILFMYLSCYILQKIIYNMPFLQDSPNETAEPSFNLAAKLD